VQFIHHSTALSLERMLVFVQQLVVVQQLAWTLS
jgi:hypothetical protein